MTNHPDETNSLRERVDEAISWFTGTDEPAPVEPDIETPGEAVAPEVGPVAGSVGTQSAVSQPVPVASDEVEQPVADAVHVAEQPAEVAPVVAAQPAAADPATEPAATGSVAEPVAAERVSTPWSEPTAEAGPVTSTVTSPGAGAATPPVSFAKPAATPEPAPALEPVAVNEPVTQAPANVDAPFSASRVVEQPVVEASFAQTSVESSDIDEPTRIYPIDASLGAPIVDESAAQPVAEASALHEPYDDFTEPLAADAAADAEAARQRSLFRDVAPPIGAGAAAMGAVPAAEKTAVFDAQEAARLRREERAARDRQLGKVIASQEDDEPPVTPFTTPTTYKSLPSFGFFLFRLVIAAVVGIRAWQHITHLTATTKMWEATVVQSPGTVAWVQIWLEIAIAVMLLLGLGTRIAGILLVVLSVAQLAFVQWGAINPFQPGATDFIGIVDVVLAGVGVLLATVGGGRAAIDGAIHTGYVKRKNSKLFA